MINKNGKCVHKEEKKSIGSSKKVTPTSIGGAKVATNDVCPHPLRQYLSNGIPKSCLSGRPCPIGYRCTYSKKAKGYYCCSNSPMFGQYKSSSSIQGCPSGSALLFPRSNQPVTCSLENKCPMGYQCMKSNNGAYHQCCTVTLTQTIPPSITPPNLPRITSTQKNKMSMSTFKMLQKWNAMGRRKGFPITHERKGTPSSSHHHVGFSNPEEPKHMVVAANPEMPQQKHSLVKTMPCPSYMVLVETEINNRPVKRCRKFTFK